MGKSFIERKYLGYKRVRSQQGLRKYFLGHFKRPFYRLLQKKFHFDPWHTTPYELRPYAVEIVDYINQQISTEKIGGGVSMKSAADWEISSET